MNEIELRFQIPPAALESVRRWVSGDAKSTATEERLQAAYFDTPSRDLARKGFALRLRREGDVWVQTLKGAADDGMTRLEHNVPLGAETPTLDVTRHADHPAGQALLALLDTLPADALQALFRTDILRRTRALRTRHGTVELAFDQGDLLAGEGDDERRAPVAELEIELKSGQPRAVLETARLWAIEKFGLTLELRTKALRGDLLARRETCAPVTSSKAVRWSSDQTRDQALQALLRGSIEPVLGNASQILAGVHQPEHLHQLRVALRRLRVGLKLLADDDEIPLHALELGAAELSRALAAARDADAQASADWRLALDKAWRALRPSAAVEVAPAAPVALTPLLAASEVQGWMLALIGWLVRPAADEAPGLARVQGRLADWRHASAKALKRMDRLDADGRHHLRRRLRRLRLGLEMALDLPGGAEGRKLSKKEAQLRARLLDKVHATQQALGAVNDLEVGLAQARERLALAMAQGDTSAAAQCGFSLGFLAPRLEQALAKAAKAAKVLRRL